MSTLTRRDFIRGSLAAAAGAGLAFPLLMKRREFVLASSE